MLRVRSLVALVGMAVAPLTMLPAQGAEVALADRAPRFLVASPSGGAPMVVDTRSVPALWRRISLDLNDVTLEQALNSVSRQAGLKLMYSKAVVPLENRVRLQASNITVAGALIELLLDAGVDVLLSRDGQLVLVRAEQGGTVAGRVTDAKTGQAIPAVGVVLEGTRWGGTSDNTGQYRIADVTPGTYTLTVSRIGYAKQSQSVIVAAGQDTRVDLRLEVSASPLDAVVVTGTLVPTEVKASPTPVSVITASDIALQRPHTMQELLRQAVPTAVSWDQPGYPSQTQLSVRGSTTFSGAGQMKVYVDGIEVADPTAAAVDPTSIERMEVIRGPQAAAIYGSDAIGGVIAIFTKRGDPTLTHPQVEVQSSLGVIQTPYTGYDGILRQTYSASVRGGEPDVSYNFGASYSHTPDWVLPGSTQSNPTVYGGIRFAQGVVAADVTGRYYVQNNPQVFSADYLSTGWTRFSKPFYQSAQFQNQGLGARISVSPSPVWTNTVTAGIERFGLDVAQTQSRLTTPSDTLLAVGYTSETKTSIGYNTSVAGRLGAGVSSVLTAGVDHYSFPVSSWFTRGALNTTGSVQTDPNRPVSASRTVVNNTGYFTQLQLGFHDALFLTAGVRAENNSEFGDSLGTPLSPRVGLSLVRSAGSATLKLRTSWGRAIRAPFPGAKLAFSSSYLVILANPQLGPERQRGGDVGVDAVFGSRGSLSVTYYNQVAEDLIDFVAVNPSASPPTYQYQNVGRVKNTGAEVEGAVNIGPVQFKAQYGYTRSRVEQLAPNYTGDLQVGDQALATPKHTAGVSVGIDRLVGTTLAAGLTYVGSWNEYDQLAIARCFGRTGPCQSTFRGYIVAYPSFVKINASLTKQITSLVWALVSVDNLGNNDNNEFVNGSPAMGRITTVGLQLRY